jgi:hypothetical protein
MSQATIHSLPFQEIQLSIDGIRQCNIAVKHTQLKSISGLFPSGKHFQILFLQGRRIGRRPSPLSDIPVLVSEPEVSVTD